MDWTLVGIGILVIIWGIVDTSDGASDFLIGPRYMHGYIRRDRHPFLFWLCIGIYMITGVVLVVVGLST